MFASARSKNRSHSVCLSSDCVPTEAECCAAMTFERYLIDEKVDKNVMHPINSRITLRCCSILLVQLQKLAS